MTSFVSMSSHSSRSLEDLHLIRYRRGPIGTPPGESIPAGVVSDKWITCVRKVQALGLKLAILLHLEVQDYRLHRQSMLLQAPLPKTVSNDQHRR